MRRLGLLFALLPALALAQYNQPTHIVVFDGGSIAKPYAGSPGSTTGGVYYDYITGHLNVSDGGTWAQIPISGDTANFSNGLCTTDTAGNLTCKDAGFQNVTAVAVTVGGSGGATIGSCAITAPGSSLTPSCGWNDSLFAGKVRLSPTTDNTTSHTSGSSESVLFMTDDATRTVTLAAPSSGRIDVVCDSSGSVTAGHTVTVSGASGNVNGGASVVITPGTNKCVVLTNDGTNYWVLSRF